MTKKEKEVLATSLRKVSQDIAEIALYLEGSDAPAPKPEKPTAASTEEKAPESEKKLCSYEDARAILAEKARTGFRAEVKSILTAHNLKQLSDAKDPDIYAAIIAEAEAIGNA